MAHQNTNGPMNANMQGNWNFQRPPQNFQGQGNFRPPNMNAQNFPNMNMNPNMGQMRPNGMPQQNLGQSNTMQRIQQQQQITTTKSTPLKPSSRNGKIKPSPTPPVVVTQKGTKQHQHNKGIAPSTIVPSPAPVQTIQTQTPLNLAALKRNSLLRGLQKIEQPERKEKKVKLAEIETPLAIPAPVVEPTPIAEPVSVQTELKSFFKISNQAISQTTPWLLSSQPDANKSSTNLAISKDLTFVKSGTYSLHVSAQPKYEISDTAIQLLPIAVDILDNNLSFKLNIKKGKTILVNVKEGDKFDANVTNSNEFDITLDLAIFVVFVSDD